MPPPTTPAPSRFLASKRSNTQSTSQKQTPNAPNSGQFRATPRFAFSTPRPPPPSSSRTGPFTNRALSLKPEPPRTLSVREIIESSPVSPQDGSPSQFPPVRDSLPEPIEFESSQLPESSPPDGYVHQEGRPPKRRRISIDITSDIESVVSESQSKIQELDELPDVVDDEFEEDVNAGEDVEIDDPDDYDIHHGAEEGDVIPETTPIASPSHFSHTPISNRSQSHNSLSPPLSPHPSSPDQPPDSPRHILTLTPRPKRINPNMNFHPAPRFFNKPSEPPDPHISLLAPLRPPAVLATPAVPDSVAAANPDLLFSPAPHQHRRKSGGTGGYIAGGLAAEVRDWLVGVKEGEAKAGLGGLKNLVGPWNEKVGILKIIVKEVRSSGQGVGAGMTLVFGRIFPEGNGEMDRGVKMILAGKGDLDGYEKEKTDGSDVILGTTIVPATVIAVLPPAWEIQLADGPWAVAYRWTVVKGVDERQPNG